MKALYSRPALAAVALLAFVVLTCLCLARQPGEGSAPGAAAAASDQSRQGPTSVDENWEDVAQRMESRQRVLREVIDGRTSLPAAAARFEEMDRASKTFNWRAFRASFPGLTDEESQCRAVIDHVNSMLVNDPDRARAVTRRLEAELRAFRERAAAGAPSAGGPFTFATRPITVQRTRPAHQVHADSGSP